jgi:autotransporter-associated beta strand protein
MSKKLNLSSALGIFLIGLFSANTSQAQLTNYTWNGSASNWTTTTSWTPSWTGGTSSAQSNNIAVFTNTGTFTNVDLSSARTVGGILFTPNAYAYTFNSANNSVLTIWDKGLTNNSGKTQTFNLGVTIGGGNAPLFAGASSTNVFAGTMTLGSTSTGRIPSFQGTGYTIVSGNIVNNASPSDITKPGVSIDTTAGAGVLFSGTNTYTGVTSIGANGGILTVDRVSALSANSFLNFFGTSGSGTALNLGGNGLSYTMNYFQAGANGWINTTNAANTATLTFTNTAGLNAATGSTSRMLGVGTGVSVIFNGDYNIAGTNGPLNGTTAKAMTFTVDGAGTTTFNGSFNGGAYGNLTNGLIKSGSGVMNLNASNALSTTATAINGGTVNLGNNGALGTAAVSMNSNSTIGVTSGTRTTANNITMASGITGTFRADSAVDWTSSGNITDAAGLATLNKTGTGTLSLSGANTYKDTTVTTGTLNARSAGALGVGTVTVSSGATLGVVGASIANAVKNSGTVSIGAGGTLAANTMAPTSGSQGALVLGGTVGNSATFNSTVAAGTSSASSLLQLGDLTMNGNSVLNLQNIYTQINAATVTFAGTGNSIGLNGKSALWGANTYTLLSGTGMTGTNSDLLLDLGAGNTVALGSSLLVGLKTYSFSQSGTALTMGITSAGVAADQVWDSSVSSGAWNTTAQNWLTDGTGSAVAFNSNDNAALNSNATITVAVGGITASAVTLTNSAATVTLDGGKLTGTSLSKSGGTLLMNNSENSFVGLTNSAGTLTSTGTLTTTSGGVTASGGTVNLNGVNSITGGLLVNGGAVALGAASTLSSDSITVSSGSLAVGASANNGGLTISGGSITGSGTLTNTSVSATGGTIAVNLAGTGGLTKTGVGTLNLDNSVNSFTGGVAVSGGTLVAGTANNLAGQAVTVNGGTLDIGGVNNAATSVALSSGSITGTTGTLTTALTATVATGVTASVNAILAGSSGLTKNGSGTLALSGANTYTGTTTVNGGTLETVGNEVLANTGTVSLINAGSTFKLGGGETVGNINAASGSAINLQSYTLTSGGNNISSTNAALTTGTGGLVKNGTGLMYFSTPAAASTYSGGFTLNEGVVQLTSSGDAGAGGVTNSVFGTGKLTLNGGTIASSSATSARTIYNNIELNGVFQSGLTSWGSTSTNMNTNSSGIGQALLRMQTTGGGTTTLLGASTINTLGYTEWDQNISGNYRITKGGTGALSLSNNYLRLAGSNNIAGVTVDSGLLGYLNRNALGTGTLILADGVAVGQAGSINNTDLADGDANRTVANNISILGNATFGTGSSATSSQSLFSGNVNLNGANRTLTVASDTYFFGSITNGGLVAQRNDTDLTAPKIFALYGANTYDGGTTVIGVAGRTNNVTLGLGNDTALGTGSLTFSGGGTNTIRSEKLSTSTDTSRTIANGIAITNGVTLSVDAKNAMDMVLNGVISGGGALIKTNANTLTLGGANSYSGGTTIAQGTLIGTTASLQGAITNNGALTFNQASSGTYGGVISGTGTLSKTNTGSVTLSSVNSYSGATTVSQGTLLVDTAGSIASSSLATVNGGLLQVNGTAGAVTVNGGGSLGGSGTNGVVTLNNGSFLNPGNSPGTLTAATAIVLGGSTYNWQISSVVGTEGTNWDLLSATTLLDMSAITGTSKWNLVVTADGAFTGWTDNRSYDYVFAQAVGLSLSSGFTTAVGTDVTSLFNITAANISLPNATYNSAGDFKVLVGRGSNDVYTLKLQAIPEPSTGSMLGLGFAGLVVTRLLRRKTS